MCRNGYKTSAGYETYDECPCARCSIRSRQVYVEGFNKLKSTGAKLTELSRIFQSCAGFVKVEPGAAQRRDFRGAFVEFEQDHQAVAAMSQMDGTERRNFTLEGGLRVVAPRFSKHFRPDEHQTQRQYSGPNRHRGNFRGRGNPRWHRNNNRQWPADNNHGGAGGDMQPQDMQAQQHTTAVMTEQHWGAPHPDFHEQYQPIPPNPLSDYPPTWGHQNTAMGMNNQPEPG